MKKNNKVNNGYEYYICCSTILQQITKAEVNNLLTFMISIGPKPKHNRGPNYVFLVHKTGTATSTSN